MSLFKILKGDSTRIDTSITPFHDGYAYFTPDDGGFYIDSEDDGVQRRIRINPEGADTTVTVTEIDGGHEVTITDKNGTQTFTVLDGEKGDMGNPGVYIGPDRPTDPDVSVWIDTSDTTEVTSAQIREDLDVYSKSEVDELVAGEAETPEAIRNNINVYSKEETDALINNVQIDIDSEISETGENAVSGAAVYRHVAEVVDGIVPEITVDQTVTETGMNPVSGAAVVAYAMPKTAIVATTEDPGEGVAVDYPEGTVILVYE